MYSLIKSSIIITQLHMDDFL